MDLIREYWWLIIVVVALVLAFVLLRPKQRVKLTDSAPTRPHMAQTRPREGRGIAGEAAAATSDVTGEILGAPVRKKLDGGGKPGDELCMIKGVGPKFITRLEELGVTRFDQLAGMNATEIAHLDERMGPFVGRLAKDRVIEQADLLARGDIETFEERFGKLTP